jgi:hypothetical protein
MYFDKMNLYKSLMPKYKFLLIHSHFYELLLSDTGMSLPFVIRELGKRVGGVKREAQSPVFSAAPLIAGSVWILFFNLKLKNRI